MTDSPEMATTPGNADGEGTAVVPVVAAPSTAPTASSLVASLGGRRYTLRFALTYLVLAVAFVGAIAGTVVALTKSVDGGSGTWATWTPRSGSIDDVTSQIADHVASKYKLNASTPLVAVVATPPQVVSGTDKILVSQAAIRKVAGSDTGIRVVTTSGFRMFQLCGIGDACAIGQGQPSETRGRLVRREALEAALYTFKYTTAKTVIAYMPPPLGSTTTNLLFLEKSNFSKQLSQPLSKTLPLETPPLPADPDTKEAATIDALTLHALYSYTYQLLQDNSAILILDPVKS